MSLDKAIQHKKEHRKEWVGKDYVKNIDKTCRNHGSCDYCKNNRLYSSNKKEEKMEQELEEFKFVEGKVDE